MKKLLLSLLAVFMVSACTSVTGVRNLDGYRCPDTGFLKGHAQSRFIHQGQEYQVRLAGLGGSCRFPSEEEVRVETISTIQVSAVEGQGHQTQNARVRIPYAVTILDPEENIIRAEDYMANVEIAAGRGVAQETSVYRFTIEGLRAAGNYKIIYHLPEGDHNAP